jgi:hypothetical protein
VVYSPRVLREHRIDSESMGSEPRVNVVANHDTVREAATEDHLVEGHAFCREMIDLGIYQARVSRHNRVQNRVSFESF